MFASAHAVRGFRLQRAAHVLERHGGDDHGEHRPTDGANVGTGLIECAGSFGRDSRIGLLNGQQASCSSGAQGATQSLDPGLFMRSA